MSQLSISFCYALKDKQHPPGILDSLGVTFTELTELFFPNRCLLCGGRATGVLCHGCAPTLPEQRERCPQCFEAGTILGAEGVCELCTAFPPPQRSLRYLWEYSGLYRELIHTIKYKPSKRLCTAMSRTVAANLQGLFGTPNWDLIIPIPSSKPALLRRGFNQCAILAAECSSELKIPWTVFGLTHQGYRMRQVEASRARRFSNVRRALRAHSTVVKGKAILLLDDVLTSGATTGIATLSLLQAGAKSVDLFTIARASSWNSTRAEIHGKLYPS